ncbi:hypothetical protein SAMN02745866_01965 [Alteromonadaceae bacterium Bs31]|nr:hypothetical protein SAMN02745866_01965 [Alteromonadaceae bacterium Bs31]
MSSDYLVIAGLRGGKRINVVPAVQPAYKLLESKAHDGNYWAYLSITCLQGLASGRLGKGNIFVRSDQLVSNQSEAFCVFLPGCCASMERRANDEYYLVNLTIDNSYAQLESIKQQTGLHKAVKSGGRWETALYKDGSSDANDSEIRIAAITDSSHSNVESAADNIAASIGKAPDAPSGKNFNVMDVHYTHDKGKLGGLKNFSKARAPLKNEDIHGSAMLLAKSMIAAKTKKMTWVSEKGGSAVLTQAMRMVADSNVKLDKHNIYLYDPTTSTNEAFKMAHLVGIEPDRDAVKTGMFNYMGNRDQLPAIFNRYRSEKGYTFGNMVYDSIGQGGKMQGIVGIGTGILGLAGLSMGVPAIPMAAAIASVLGVAATGVSALKIGDTLAENIAPHKYNKHIGKIK